MFSKHMFFFQGVTAKEFKTLVEDAGGSVVTAIDGETTALVTGQKEASNVLRFVFSHSSVMISWPKPSLMQSWHRLVR